MTKDHAGNGHDCEAFCWWHQGTRFVMFRLFYLRIHVGQTTCLISFILFLIAPELLRICTFNRAGAGWKGESTVESELRIGFTEDGLLVSIYCCSLEKQQELQKKLADQMGPAVVFLGQPRV